VLVSFNRHYVFAAVFTGDAIVYVCISKLMAGVCLYQLWRQGSFKLAVR
jgi:hypothetical protein